MLLVPQQPQDRSLNFTGKGHDWPTPAVLVLS